jgi:hypothetical protein
MELERRPVGRRSGLDEAWLQRLLFDHPSLLPVAEIEPSFRQLVPGAREVACGHGFIDNLHITPAGEIVLIETTKLSRNCTMAREPSVGVRDESFTFVAFERHRLRPLDLGSRVAQQEGQARTPKALGSCLTLIIVLETRSHGIGDSTNASERLAEGDW